MDKAMDGWTMDGWAEQCARSAVHKSLILTVPLPTLSTASSTTAAERDGGHGGRGGRAQPIPIAQT